MAGVRSVISAFSFLARNGMLSSYVWIFFVILIVMIGGMSAVWAFRSWVMSLILGGPLGAMIADGALPSWVGSLGSGIMTVIITIISFAISLMIAGYIALILLSPLFSHLAQKTYTIVTGRELPSSFRLLVWGIVRGVGISVRNMFIQLLLIALLFIGTFIPVVGVACPILMFVVDAFYVGFCMADYSLELKGMSIGESIRFGRQNRGLMAGIGFLYALVMKLPILGIYIAILIAPACVVGAAIEMFQADEERFLY